MKIEWWKFVPGYECKYMASDYGRVLSMSYGKTGKPGLLYLNEHDNGYIYVTLYQAKKRKDLRVNRLIAFTFPEICGEWFEGAQCNHLNGNRKDNRAINLKWVTDSENKIWGTRIKTISKNLKNRKDCSKPVKQFSVSGELIKSYPSASEASRETGIGFTSILKCCKGVQKITTKNGAYAWEFA